MSSWATDLPEKISVLQTFRLSQSYRWWELPWAHRSGEGTNSPSMRQGSMGDHINPLPILCSKERRKGK